MVSSRVTAVQPDRAVEGGRISVFGTGFDVDATALPEVAIGGHPARIVFASSSRLDVIVPPSLQAGRLPITIDGRTDASASVIVGSVLASGLHQVDSPACDRRGNVYVTDSGARGQATPVSVFRIDAGGARHPFAEGIVNATSVAVDPVGQVYVSSRFEGIVYRLDDAGRASPFATELGVTCGLAFAADGVLYAGDRSGTIFRIDARGRAEAFATLPPSVAAFHLAIDRDQMLYVTGPTLATYDAVYRIDRSGAVGVVTTSFGRPQGLAIDPDGTLFVVEAAAGSTGVYRVRKDGHVERVIAGRDLIGIAFDYAGHAVVCSSEQAYRLPAESAG